MIDKILYRGIQGFIVALNIGIFLPAVLWRLGYQGVAQKLYNLLGLLCHQMPDRSFFLFGQQFQYSKDQLLTVARSDSFFTINIGNRFVCADSIGCKFGICSRCTGMYSGMFIGMIASKFIERFRFQKWLLLILLVPMALDGGIQLIASLINPALPFYVSNNRLRFVTGFAFGFGFASYAFIVLRRELGKTATLEKLSKQ